MTFDKIDFALFCIGSIAERLKLNQTEVYDKLQQSGILQNFIVEKQASKKQPLVQSVV